MPFLMLKDLPRYECLLAAAQEFPQLDVTACATFLQLLRTADEVFSAKARFLAAHNTSNGRFTVLMLLHRTGEPQTPASLAEQSGVTRATMTGLIDTLEKDGFARREHDAADRRALHVHLSAKGEAFLRKVLPGYFECISAVLHPLDERERKLLAGLLQKIQTGLAATAPVAA